ncbi:MAG: DUF4492 domain-containing protein [Proteobacteria bacterium]|nr:DUF4492 domain-containing protein [Pseudomonadota bacterium]
MKSSILMRCYGLYRDGFREMTVGRTLWKIIVVKLIVMFVVLKLFFFPNFLKTNFSTDQQRADHVLFQLTGSAGINPDKRDKYLHEIRL